MANQRATAVVLGLVAALVVSACGGASHSSTPTRASYTAKANAICATASHATTPLIGQVVAAARSLGSAHTLTAGRQLSEALSKLHTTTSGALTKLRALSQPASGRAAIQRFLTPFATVTATIGRAATAAQSGRPQVALGELGSVATGARQVGSTAAAYGLTSCETVFASPALAGLAQSVHVTFSAPNHAPTVGKPWPYVVTVTDAQGHRLSGTETTQFTFAGSVVGTEKPVNRPFTNGVFRDTLKFPPDAVGHPLAVRAVVRTSQGSGSASWPIQVKP